MKLEQFQELLDAYGGDQSTWPKAERPAAARLLASSQSARTALAEARALDRLIRRGLGARREGEQEEAQAAERLLARLGAEPLPAQVLPAQALPAKVFAFGFRCFPFGFETLRSRAAALACAGALGAAIALLSPELIAPGEPERFAAAVEVDAGSLAIDVDPEGGAVL